MIPIKPFEVDVLRKLTDGVLAPGVLDVAIQDGDFISYDYNGHGYYLTFSHQQPPIFNDFDQFGLFDGKDGIWTGTMSDGTSAGAYSLGGSSGSTIVGLEEPEPWDTPNSWLNDFSGMQTKTFYGLYAISSLLVVPAPEPSTLSLAALGFAALVAWRWGRR